MTTKLDFDLATTQLETETVVVMAERPAIQKDLTSSQQSFDGEEILEAPVVDLGQLMSTQAGVSAVESVERAFIANNYKVSGDIISEYGNPSELNDNRVMVFQDKTTMLCIQRPHELTLLLSPLAPIRTNMVFLIIYC